MPATSPATVVIKTALLADGLGGAPKSEQSVSIVDGRISAVGPSPEVAKDVPPETEVVDLGSACLVPGLIDGHTHLGLSGDDRSYIEMFSDSDEMMVFTGAANMSRHLQAGITTLREHGARNRVGFTLKEGLARGYLPGPRLLVSGRPITCTGGHFHMCNEIADGEEELRKSVRRLVHEGADYIKIMTSGGGTVGTIPALASYTRDELHAVVHEAQRFRRLTAAHCRARDSMENAVRAGIDLIEHCEFLHPDSGMTFDPQLAALMAEAGTWLSPTLQAWTRYPTIVELRTRRDGGLATPREEEQLTALEQRSETRLDVMRRMLDYCLKERIVPGTDSGVGNLAFGHLDYDLQLLVEVGFTPGEALVAATRISADAVGMGDELGTIEVGKVADLAAVAGDPTKDIHALSRVEAVFQGGIRVK